MSQERGQRFLLELPTLRHELPYSPALLTALFAQTGPDSDTPLETIAETLSHDQGLTAKVLALANSAFYGLQQKVTTVSRALAVLGLAEVRTLVLTVGVKTLAESKGFPKDFDLGSYWEHQLSVAVIARALAPTLGAPDPDALFTAGVLHDLGKLLTALHSPDDWRAIRDLAQERRIPYAEAEEDYWGIEHGVIGSMVLGAWNLPESLTEPVNWHHAPMHAPSGRRAALTLCVADALAHALNDQDAPVACPWQEVLLRFGLDDRAAMDLADDALTRNNPALLSSGLAA
ncbi:HDOD domain-containing protein [Fundidesulfovibrio butyratiphilus]